MRHILVIPILCSLLFSVGCTVRYSQSLTSALPQSQGREVRSSDTGFNILQITIDEPRSAHEQVRGLMAGGVDILLPETTFDTLNLKAALFAIEHYFAKHNTRVPVIASITITDQSGRTLSGQTVEAAWNSIAHIDLLAMVGATVLLFVLLFVGAPKKMVQRWEGASLVVLYFIYIGLLVYRE